MHLYQDDLLMRSFLKKYGNVGKFRSLNNRKSKEKLPSELLSKYNRWTKEQIDILVKIYPEHSNHYIAEILGKTKSSIDSKASLLHLKKSENHRKTISQKNGKSKHHSWKNEEIEYLKQNFKLKTYVQIANDLYRTPSSIFQKARQLFLKKYKAKNIIS